MGTGRRHAARRALSCHVALLVATTPHAAPSCPLSADGRRAIVRQVVRLRALEARVHPLHVRTVYATMAGLATPPADDRAILSVEVVFRVGQVVVTERLVVQVAGLGVRGVT